GDPEFVERRDIGYLRERVMLVTASDRMRSDCRPALPVERSAMIMLVSPAIAAVTAGAPPRYGMLRISASVMALNNSSARSVADPPVACVSWPGSFLASAISSGIELAGTLT